DGDLVFQSEAANSLLGEFELASRQGDSVAANPVVLGCITEQSAPAATDIEQLLARLQSQLAADHFQLVGLRLRKGVVPVAEIAATVLHLGIENKLVELVAQIVMELDKLRVIDPLGAPILKPRKRVVDIRDPLPSMKKERERLAHEPPFAQAGQRLLEAR